MAIRLYRAYSPGTRSRSSLYFDDLSKNNPEKSLTFGKKRCSGRNNRGVITLNGRGGGHKRKYRLIDFKRKNARKCCKMRENSWSDFKNRPLVLSCFQVLCHVILVFMPMLFEIISTMSFFIEHHSKSALKSLENIFSKMLTDVVGTLLQKTFSGVILL